MSEEQLDRKDGEGPRVLLVEDDFDEQHLVMRVIRDFDNRIVLEAAHTGKEALLYLDNVERGELPKLVLLDLDLPIVGGIEVLRRIRQRPATRGIPVTVFSGSERPSDLAACESLQASFVRKPPRHEEYVKTLQTILHYWINLNRTTYESSFDDQAGGA